MFTTVGHQKQKDFLQNLLDKKQYSHAYLFTGPAEIGKRTLAMEFAVQLLDIGHGKAACEVQHPDLMCINGAEFGISETRDLLATLSLAPFSAAKKIVIIDNFEQASREASHAFLKTIEEPSPTTIVILIAENYKALLPTVVSRTQRLHFAALSTAEIAAALPTIPNPWRFNGRIGRAMRMAADSDYATRFEYALAELTALKKTPPAERLLRIKKLADLEDGELEEMIRWWSEAEQTVLPSRPQMYPNLTSCAAALSGLRRNFNKKLVLQKIVLELIP